ncbi:MAG: response regulator transcription factor [Firmicutes bacterium]|nr:response regulator transcription factor [Bacillota bacterium]
MEKIKVALVDDQVLFLESLRTVLSTRAKDLKVVGVAHNGEEAIRLIEEERPDVVLMDIRMPGMDGVLSTRLIKQKYPQIRVLMLTIFDDDEYVVEALRVGASGYLLKEMPPAELIAAVRAVAKETGVLISPRIASKLVSKLVNLRGEGKAGVHETGEAPPWLKELSPREREILGLIARGLDNKEIAERLHLAEQTVKNYVSLIYDKIGARDRVQASLMALEAGLVKIEGD